MYVQYVTERSEIWSVTDVVQLQGYTEHCVKKLKTHRQHFYV